MTQLLTEYCTRTHAIQLFQISNLLRHAGFIKLVLNVEGRFDAGVNHAISTKIGNTLIDDVRTYVFHSSDSGLNEFRGLSLQSDKHLLKRLFNKAGEAMAVHAKQLDKDIPESAKRFTVSNGQCFIERAMQLIGYAPCLPLKQAVTAWTSPCHCEYRVGLRLSYLNHVLSALYCFIEAKDSLVRPVENVLIEAYLAYANERGADYWSKGYPYDVLVHDKVTATFFNQSKGFRGLGFKEDYVSTYAWADNNGLTQGLVEEYADHIITHSNCQAILKRANQG